MRDALSAAAEELFLTRARHDTAFDAWNGHETHDIAGLVDDLVSRLRAIAADMPAEFSKSRK